MKRDRGRQAIILGLGRGDSQPKESPVRGLASNGAKGGPLEITALMRERRLLPVTPWQPAVLFGGRTVRFVYSRNRELLELFADAGAG